MWSLLEALAALVSLIWFMVSIAAGFRDVWDKQPRGADLEDALDKRRDARRVWAGDTWKVPKRKP